MSQQEITQSDRERRREVYREIVGAFETKYSWLGRQTARELLMSAASWNIQQHSSPPMRYRTHVMLSWDRGYGKSTMLRKMANILGEDLCSTMGKVTDAALRGSTRGSNFMPPRPLRTPILISTEFGQTDFEGELLNQFHDLLEEGHTNISLNKIGSLSDEKRRAIENKYDGKIEFKEKNEFDLKTQFVFWGATYDPSKLADDALRSRFNVVTPAKSLDSSITYCADHNPDVMAMIDNKTIREVTNIIKSEKTVPTDFRPPKEVYETYSPLSLRESRDIQAYMACRNWWGLDVNKKIMTDYMQYLRDSRRIAHMNPQDRILDLIFDNPSTYTDIKNKTGLKMIHIHRILNQINADRWDLSSDETRWVVWSGDGNPEEIKEEVRKEDKKAA